MTVEGEKFTFAELHEGLCKVVGVVVMLLGFGLWWAESHKEYHNFAEHLDVQLSLQHAMLMVLVGAVFYRGR